MNANNMRSLMIDIETLGTCNDAAILSLGAVIFDPTTGEVANTEHGGTFDLVIDLDGSKFPGTIQPSTVKWWMGQSDEARQSIFGATGTYSLGDALVMFGHWLTAIGFTPETRRDWQVWANDPDFDLSILQSAYERYGIPIPWSYSTARSMRTMRMLADRYEINFAGVVEDNEIPHNALADAIHQARVVSAIQRGLDIRVGQNVGNVDPDAGTASGPGEIT